MTTGRACSIRLHPGDNVVVARTDLTAGALLDEEGITATEPVPAGHKVATTAIAVGETVRKYEQIIGIATAPIEPGQHVHTHNLGMEPTHERDYAVGRDLRPTDILPEAEQAQFMGIRRRDGRVATRNYLGVLTTVNCSATVARLIARAFDPARLTAFGNVDGIVSFVHGAGCCVDTASEGFGNLQRTLWGFARHPNLGGLLVVGLGCETNQMDLLLAGQGIRPGPRLRTLNIQETGGTAATVARGVALQCGGSDGYSGITANPALGAAVDLLVKHGGTAILAETPEIYGAEHLLTRRAASPAVADRLLHRIRWWEHYAAIHGGEMDNNPTPGNKAGGLTTILEKSLGAVAKGGTTALNAVYEYAEQVNARGLVFMDSPGYDPCSITGEVAGGANLVCFTTGRGSVYGCKPAPSLKLATNTPMFRRLEADMDLDCGVVADGQASVQDMGRRIFDRILATASGEPTKSEAQGFGDEEFVPWQVGAQM